MNYGKKKMVLALLVGLAATAAVLFLLSPSNTRAAILTADSGANNGPDALRGREPITIVTSLTSAQPAVIWNNHAAEGDEACTIGIATGGATVDGRPVLWKNRDFYGHSDAWQANLFWHKATNNTFSISDTFGDRFNYVAVSDRGDLSDLRDITETLYYPRMGANERGLAVVSAQAHTLADDVQTKTVGIASQDPKGIRNGGLNHWILSRCETIDEVEQLLTDTNNGGGYNDSTARNTASLIAVIDRTGGAAIFEVDGNSFARENITKEFAPLDERLHSSGPPAGGYTGSDYRSNFSRITFTNTKICSNTYCFPYFPDKDKDGINDLEYSESSRKRYGRVVARMDDSPKDVPFFIQKWLRKGSHPRENYLETVARSVGYAPYLSSSEFAWRQEKSVGYHLNRFVTVSSAVIVGSKADDQDEGRLATMWVALGEPSVAVFVPLFPYAGEPPAVLNDFFLSINAKRRLVYDYEVDAWGYPIDNIDADFPYTRLRNFDHSIDLSALFGGNYYGEGGLQAYNFAIEERLFEEYSKTMETWRALAAADITSAVLASWQTTWATWAAEEYVKSDPTVVVSEVNRLFSEDGHISLMHDFVGPTIVEVIAKGVSDGDDWPGIRVQISGTYLTEVGGETGANYIASIRPTHATNKAKSVDGDLDDITSRFALYRYRMVYTGTTELRVEVISATVTATVEIDKVLLRTESRSVEMYEVEKDWDAKSDSGVRVDDYSILISDTAGYFDIYHYAWGLPLTIKVVAKGCCYSTFLPTIFYKFPELSEKPIGGVNARSQASKMNSRGEVKIPPSKLRKLSDNVPMISLTCDSQLVGTATLNCKYAVYAFDWDPGSEGQVTCRIQAGNAQDIRVDKLLVKEGLPVYTNTAPTGDFTVDSTINGPTMTITATAVVTDPDGDTIASYFWGFGDEESYCSGNPKVTHTYSVTQLPSILTLHATDHRGKTAVIHKEIQGP